MHRGHAIPTDLDLRALVSDVDGVLTDGLVGLSASGHKFRQFHVHDGMGARLLIGAGVRVGWISASTDDGVIRARAAGLGVHAVDVGDGDKGERLRRLCATLGVLPAQSLYIGDDVNDLPAIALAGYAVCPADARPEIRAAANQILEARGGRGAFREAADMLLAQLRARGTLPQIHGHGAHSGILPGAQGPTA